MATLVEAHIEAERRLRLITTSAIGRLWKSLGSWDQPDAARFERLAVPTVLAAQRQSVALTEAYLARSLERRPIGVDVADLIGAGVRNGTAPAEVYKRPFVTMWAALGDGELWQDAFNAGLARAQGAAAMDVQLAMARTAQAVGTVDPEIQRFQRVADGSACDLCQEVDGAILNSDEAMPLHNNCGCGIEPLTDGRPLTPKPEGVAVHEHGELGPVLAAPGDNFTSLGALGLPEFEN